MAGSKLDFNQKKPMAEINVTPLVDVMLVLLVIFMISAPLLLNNIPLDLPKTQRSAPVQLTNDQVIISYSRNEEIFLGKDKILMDELIPLIKEKLSQTNKKVVFLRADHGLKYGFVAKFMTYLKNNGIGQIALITEVEK
jgi:biopolymer transport protein ExbD